MPKINPIKISLYAHGNIHHREEYETHVLSDSTFQTLIPTVDLDRLRVLDTTSVEITKNKAEKPVLKSRALENIHRLLESYGRSMLETTTESSFLIFYKVTLDVAYCTNPHLPGRVFANGYTAKRETGGDNDYRWQGVSNNGLASSSRHAVGVMATVVEKVIHRLADGRFYVEHQRAKLPEGSSGASLNEFNSLVLPPKDYWSATDPHTPRVPPGRTLNGDILISEGLHYLEYSEEAAEFFFNMMINLATLAERMRTFFGDGVASFLENLNDPNKLRLLAGK